MGDSGTWDRLQGSLWSSLRSIVSPPDHTTVRKLEHFYVLLALGGASYRLYQMGANGPRDLVKGLVGSVLGVAKAVPGLKNVVEAEEQKTFDELEQDLLGDGDPDANFELPIKGKAYNEVIEKATELKERDDGNNGGKKWGGIYHADGGVLTRLQNELLSMYNCTNALYPGVFPAIRKFEAEMISMVKTMLHGDANSVGLYTSGGTESIFLAVLAYRNYARTQYGIYSPEIVCNAAAHPALDKACGYLDIKVVKLGLKDDMRLHAEDVEPYINKNTIAIYASAPTFPHGVIDPIPALGQLGLKYKVPLHVDNCLGGFLLSPLKELGLIPPEKNFDFEVPGVTSISCDGHKYGLSTKGASFILFRDNVYRRATVHGITDWAGGLYVTSTLQGSRSGAVMAATWGTMMHLGREGYQEVAMRIQETHKWLVNEINNIPELRTIMECDTSIVSFVSDTLDIYRITSEMTKKGWSVTPLQLPPAGHICVGETTTNIKEEWISDLKKCVETVKSNPGIKATGTAGIYGTTAVLPDSQVEDVLKTYCDIRVKVKGKNS